MIASKAQWCKPLAWLAAGLGLALTVAACVLLWLRMLSLGVAGQWLWPLRQVPVSFGLSTLAGVILVAAAAAYVIHLLRLRSPVKPDQYVLAVLLCCIAALGMMAGLYLAEDYPHARTARATVAIAALPYYGEAVLTDEVSDLLQSYGDFEGRQGLPDRLRTHPPGPVLYFVYARRVILTSPALLELGHRLLASEGIFPADSPRLTFGYTSVRMTAEDVASGLVASLFLGFLGVLTPAALFLVAMAVTEPKTALVSALLAAVIPSLLLFVPSIDGLGTVVVLCALAAFLWSLRRESYALAVLSGLLWAAAFFWSIGLLVLVLPAAAVLTYYIRRPGQRRAALALSAIAAGVFALTFVVLYLAAAYNPVSNIAEILRSQEQIMARAGRGRLAWTFVNLYDFGLFFGPMLAVTSLAGLACALYGSDPRGTDSQGRLSHATGYMGIGLLAAFVLLDASGSTRGEVGRIWVFFMPLFAIYAAHLRSYVAHRWQACYLALLLAAQLATAICLFAYIIPVQA